ncbi:MAG: tRNA (cytidine(34)-2'-O)-methyltransferase [Acholeplasmatales bacterium]|nr:MAG: tRNA (cytidine(34)-2'-O)-methyltransferase [Acholeplasmatales bacterium]
MNHVVLFEPEIPQNTGNIIRTCVATNTVLHLIRPLGFMFSERTFKRFAVNHFEHLDYRLYDDFDDFFAQNSGRFYFLTRYGEQTPDRCDFALDAKLPVYLIFGKESTGLPEAVRTAYPGHCFRLPMTDKVRSLNLANTVAIVLYEALRQQHYPGLHLTEPVRD